MCRNPLLAAERKRKRDELMAATERNLSRIRQAVLRKRAPLRGRAEIGLAVGSVLDKHKMGKHFEFIITDTSLVYRRTDETIAAEARLDGIYVIRTNLPQEALSPEDTVGAYKALAQVERAFRSTKSVDLEIRPVFHWTAPRVRAHVFLCMLAYYVEFHMREAAGPGWFMAGDAAATLDPTSSHGVLKAIMSGTAAGHLIAAVLDGRAPAEATAGAYREWLAGWFSADAARLTQFYRSLGAAAFA